MKYTYILTTLIVLPFFTYTGRSFLRKKDPTMPELMVRYEGDKHFFSRKASHLEKDPTFTFNFSHNPFKPYQLPESITWQDKKTISKKELTQQLESLIAQIKEGKTEFDEFNIIQRKNFNFTNGPCGSLVLESKKHPFIFKLFMETPQTFLQPSIKGWDPIFFDWMSSANRHTLSLTRIVNLHKINELIKQSEKWKNMVVTPRKWFWIPENNKPLHIIGKNIGDQKQLETIIPSVYGIIEDKLSLSDKISIPEPKRRELVISLCNDLENRIDPHYNNFTFIDVPDEHMPLIAIIDTEHLPSMIGLKQKKKISSYLDWYSFLVTKCFKDKFLQTKNMRRNSQKSSILSLF